MKLSEVAVKSILTRTSGYLQTVSSHTLQPYRGCSYGNSLCGVACYVQHNYFVTRGRPWGQFLEVRQNAAEVYRRQFQRERDWAREECGRFAIFCSSSTDPFVPQEKKYQITRSLLEAMRELPPDELILQTHSHLVTEQLELLVQLQERCDLRVHVSIETDREKIPGLPPHASSVANRIEACRKLKTAGVTTVVTVAPLLPIEQPDDFFQQLSEVCDAIVIDHFIEGDGSHQGARTLKTTLPQVMADIHPGSEQLDYRTQIVEIAEKYLPGRVGIGPSGFAGDMLKPV